ncbi:DinB family protein [Algibacter miyuki]|uniref:DinB family protein n=1 Tax=Algibacter miyuki TaxID=1306933 RepID=A0ABV5GZB4_9FLAO|nr:DinB family protein [Algibacter miyuki]MDN3666823.1 hypothetical protein [Algibacter miyuki]
MNTIIEPSLKTLRKAQVLLEKLSDDDLCNASISPYYSSIGTHLRHIFDFYDCIFNRHTDNKIDLTARRRNTAAETACCNALSYLNTMTSTLETLDVDVEQQVVVIDDLGLGKTEILYTYGALLAQANSHTIHHYAIINYILDRLKLSFDDTDFGYNPTTPKAASEKC